MSCSDLVGTVLGAWVPSCDTWCPSSFTDCPAGEAFPFPFRVSRDMYTFRGDMLGRHTHPVGQGVVTGVQGTVLMERIAALMLWGVHEDNKDSNVNEKKHSGKWKIRPPVFPGHCAVSLPCSPIRLISDWPSTRHLTATTQ